MIRQDTPLSTINIILSSAVTTSELSIIVSYSNKNGATYNGSRQRSVSNGTTAQVISDAPAAGVIKDIDTIHILNEDSTAKTLWVFEDADGIIGNLTKKTINPDDLLIYTHAGGWIVTDVNGAIKGIGPAGPTGLTDWTPNTTPTETMDGVNTLFTVPDNYVPGSLCLYYNGSRQLNGIHFTEVPPNQYNTVGFAPDAANGDNLINDYLKS